jgi:hypothetical protein
LKGIRNTTWDAHDKPEVATSIRRLNEAIGKSVCRPAKAID